MPERNPPAVARGDRVRINYCLTLEDDTVVDSSEEGGPMELVMGDGSLLPALESVIMGMLPGGKRVRVLPPKQGFGLSDAQLVHEFPRDSFAPDVIPQPGLVMSFDGAGDEPIAGTIIGMDSERVRVDLNHPLAGHTVTFAVELAPAAG